MRLAALLAIASAMHSQIIFDTDSGFFSDDGAALTILMRSRLADSVGAVTVISGNVWAAQGARYMERNLRLLKHPNVPVLVGAQEPLVHTAEMVKREGSLEFTGALGEKPEFAPATTSNAIDHIIRTIDSSPGTVTYIALGPLTNLAIVLRLRPDLGSKLGTLIMMGGAVNVPGNTTKKAEFNFWFDPEAAQAVMRSAIPTKILFALDITNQAPIRKADYEEIARVKTPITELYAQDMGDQFPAFNRNPNAVTYMWDPLVTAYLVDNSIVTASSNMHLDIDTRFGPGYGAVMPLDRSLAPRATPVRVMTKLDTPKAWALYRTALTAKE